VPIFQHLDKEHDMALFRLLFGKHVGPGPSNCDCERCTADAERTKNKELFKGVKGHIYNRGDIVESDKDLVSRFPNKFQMVDASGRVVETQMRPITSSNEPRDFLNTMTKQELTDYAAGEEIDLAGCNTKPEIMQAIRMAVGAAD